MQGLSQAIFVILKGMSMGFVSLVLVGVASFFSYVLFSRRSPGYAWLWTTLVSLVVLGGILYFAGGKELMGLPATVDGQVAEGVDDPDLMLGFAANAISGLVGIFAGIKLRRHYWPTNRD